MSFVTESGEGQAALGVLQIFQGYCGVDIVNHLILYCYHHLQYVDTGVSLLQMTR